MKTQRCRSRKNVNYRSQGSRQFHARAWCKSPASCSRHCLDESVLVSLSSAPLSACLHCCHCISALFQCLSLTSPFMTLLTHSGDEWRRMQEQFERWQQWTHQHGQKQIMKLILNILHYYQTFLLRVFMRLILHGKLSSCDKRVQIVCERKKLINFYFSPKSQPEHIIKQL